MTYRELLVNLEEPISRISNGINAVGIMAMGLAQVHDPYADGFFAVWNYLDSADQELKSQVETCFCQEDQDNSMPTTPETPAPSSSPPPYSRGR